MPPNNFLRSLKVFKGDILQPYREVANFLNRGIAQVYGSVVIDFVCVRKILDDALCDILLNILLAHVLLVVGGLQSLVTRDVILPIYDQLAIGQEPRVIDFLYEAFVVVLEVHFILSFEILHLAPNGLSLSQNHQENN